MAKESMGESKQSTRKQWVYIMLMVNIVFILLLMTLGIIALRVGNTLPEGVDVLFIVGKNPSVDFEDSNEGGGKWKSGKNVDMFKAQYENGEGTPTVVSQDGTKLIAPGTKTTYRFTMNNDGNMAVDYFTDLDFVLKIGNETVTDYQFPLQVRLLNDRGEYLIGDENTYEQVAKASLDQYRSILGAKSFETFELQLIWLFEGGNDELDTLYGDLSAEKGVTLTLTINTTAEESLDPTAQGGTKMEVEGTEEYGGTIRWLWLVMLMLNTAIIVFYVAWLMNKRVQKW